MAERNRTKNLHLRNPWLVAAWPGMGQVATGAVGSLIETLGAEPAGMIPGAPYFDLDHVDISDGIARAGTLPRNLFFVWRDPDRERDTVLFLAEAQPTRRASDLCRRIAAFAREQGVQRIVTFAALPTQMEPAGTPSVHAAVTAPELIQELRDAGVPLLTDGKVGGLNGTLLAAAASAGVPAMCLLGEMPFFAAGAPNLKTSLATVETFTSLAGLDVDLSELHTRADDMQSQLEQMFGQLRDQAMQQLASLADQFDIDVEVEIDDDDDPEGADGGHEPGDDLDVESKLHIETLFHTVAHDRSRAVELKAELDRLGVYEEYEDRFLDLFT